MNFCAFTSLSDGQLIFLFSSYNCCPAFQKYLQQRRNLLSGNFKLYYACFDSFLSGFILQRTEIFCLYIIFLALSKLLIQSYNYIVRMHWVVKRVKPSIFIMVVLRYCGSFEILELLRQEPRKSIPFWRKMWNRPYSLI